MKSYIFSLILTALSGVTVITHAQYRGAEFDTSPASAATKVNKPAIKTGRNIALIIGTDTYASWERLSNPVSDATTIGGILRSKFNYDTILLVNPSKDVIYKHLRDLRDDFSKGKYDENTNLFIFIAGHGSYDNFSKGYLVPADAKEPDKDVSKSSYIEYTSIKDKINEINATHILMVLDVCRGGTFDAIKTSSSNTQQPCKTVSEGEYAKIKLSEFIKRSGDCRSRKFIASGGNERVADGKPGEHSPFAKEIIDFLNKSHNNQKVTSFRHLCYNISDINTSKAVFSDFSAQSGGSDYLFVPANITTDDYLDHYYKAPPSVKGYTDPAAASGKILILPRQNNYESISNTLNDPAMRAAITYITDAFQNQNIVPVYYDFTAAANAKDDKQQIIKKSGADTYIEVDLKTASDGTGRTMYR